MHKSILVAIDRRCKVEELGRQASEAVQMFSPSGATDELAEIAELAQPFEADEPSDEVLLQLENEESIMFDDEEDAESGGDGAVDYAKMTVAELKDELNMIFFPDSRYNVHQ